MSAPYHTILTKAEDNLYSYLDANRGTYLTGVDMHKTFAGVEHAGSFVKIMATSAEPENIDGFVIEGNYHLTVDIFVLSNISDTNRTAHVNMVGELADLMWQDNLTALLNAIGTTDYTVYWIRQGTIEQGAEETTAYSKLQYQIYCKPS